MRWWLALLLLGATPAQAADWVRSVAQRGDFPLVAQGQAARIVTDPARLARFVGLYWLAMFAAALYHRRVEDAKPSTDRAAA